MKKIALHLNTKHNKLRWKKACPRQIPFLACSTVLWQLWLWFSWHTVPCTRWTSLSPAVTTVLSYWAFKELISPAALLNSLNGSGNHLIDYPSLTWWQYLWPVTPTCHPLGGKTHTHSDVTGARRRPRCNPKENKFANTTFYVVVLFKTPLNLGFPESPQCPKSPLRSPLSSW